MFGFFLLLLFCFSHFFFFFFFFDFQALKKRKDFEVASVLLSSNKITDGFLLAFSLSFSLSFLFDPCFLEGVKELIEILPDTVSHVDLSFNQIGEEGFFFFFQAFSFLFFTRDLSYFFQGHRSSLIFSKKERQFQN